MRRKTAIQGILLALFGVVLAVSTGAWQWPSDGFNAARTGANPANTSITPANVAHLKPEWNAKLVSAGTDPVLAGGRVFVAAEFYQPGYEPAGELYAFAAGGGPRCRASLSVQCRPLWVVSPGVGSTTPTIFNGQVMEDATVYSQSEEAYGSISAYRAKDGKFLHSVGQEGYGASEPPTVKNNLLYATYGFGSVDSNDTGFEAVDLASGKAKFFAQGNGAFGYFFSAPAVGSGRLFGAQGPDLEAFDAGTGIPLWSAVLSSTVPIVGSPVVSAGQVFVATDNGVLASYPAKGCGSSTCSPSWTATVDNSALSSPVVLGSSVYVSSHDGRLLAFPAGGCGKSQCQPLWMSRTMSAPMGMPSGAGSLLFVGDASGQLLALQASGCGHTVCKPLWKTGVGSAIGAAPAIGNGQVFVTDATAKLHAFYLPG